jgi:hypothetical protein
VEQRSASPDAFHFCSAWVEVYTESVLSKRKVYLSLQKDFGICIPQDTMMFSLVSAGVKKPAWCGLIFLMAATYFAG